MRVDTRSRASWIAWVATLLVALPARAQDPGSMHGERDGWRIAIEPYVVIPMMSRGDARVRDHTVSVDADVTELVPALQFTAGTRLEVWFQMWALILDAQLGSVGSGIAPSEQDVVLDTGLFVADTLLAVRPLRWRAAPDGSVIVAFEIDGGLRTTHLQSDLERDERAFVSARDTLFQGVAGANVPVQIGDHLVLRLAGQVQAPDLGGNVTGHVEILFGALAIDVGYRWSHVAHFARDLEIDLDVHGVFAGLALRWGESRFYP